MHTRCRWRLPRYRLQALRIEPSTKSTIDNLAKLTAVVDRLSERLHGSADTTLPQALQEFYRRIKMKTVDPSIRPITEVAKHGSWTGNGRSPVDDQAREAHIPSA
jgi:hypothetical protein